MGFRSYLVLLIVVTTAFYFPSLFFDYVWDDTILFLDKAALVNAPLSWALLSEPVLPGTSYFRPAVFFSWYVEFAIFGQNPFVSHAVNIFMHVISVCLIYSLAQIVGHTENRKWVAFVCALFYAIHPALVEGVSWVSGRFDVMATMFLLLAVRCWFADSLSYGAKLTVVCFFYLVSLLSKEVGIVFLFLGPLLVWAGIKNNSLDLRRGFIAIGAVFLTTVVYFYARSMASGGIYHSSLDGGYIRDTWLPGWPLKAMAFYVIQVCLPFFDLSPVHPAYQYIEQGALYLALGVVSIVVSFFCFVSHFRFPSRGKAFFLGAIIAIGPVLHIIPLSVAGNLGHARFLTLPLALLSISLSSLNWSWLYDNASRLFLYFCTGLALLWFFWSIWTGYDYQKVWQNDLMLWSYSYEANEHYEYAKGNYLSAALSAGREDLLSKYYTDERVAAGFDSLVDQIFYAQFLLKKGNAESPRYYEGILYAVPEVNMNGDVLQQLSPLGLTAHHMASIYSNYALGLLIFDDDVTRALQYNEYARSFLSEAEMIRVDAQKTALLMVMGKDEEAKNLYDWLSSLTFYYAAQVPVYIKNIYLSYCKERGMDMEICNSKLDSIMD